MWYKDAAGYMNEIGGENVGATKQRDLTANGKTVDMIGYLHDDVFRQTRLLTPGVTVKVRFVRVPNSFVSSGSRLGQNGYFQCNFVHEEMQGQPRGFSCR